MPINFGQPTESQTVAARNTSMRDALAWLGKWGEGDASITSPPVGLKRFNSLRIEEWNGSAWATKGLNADQLTTGTIPVARIGGGTNGQFVRGDGAYSSTLLGPFTVTPAAGGFSINAAGNFTITAPASGDTLTLGGSTLRINGNGTLANDGTTTYLRGSVLAFQNSAASVTFGTISAAGNWTINTPSSGAALTVDGGGPTGLIASFNSNEGYVNGSISVTSTNINGIVGYQLSTNSGSATAALTLSTADFRMGSASALDLVFTTNASSRMILNAAGTLFYPANDNVVQFGAGSHRWTQIWAFNGTIQTSDARDKEVEQSIDADAARRFVARVAAEGVALARWKVGGNTAEQVLDGEDVVIEKHFDLVPTECANEDGSTTTVMVEVPAERERRTPRYRTVVTPIAGKRLHSVFLAQTVQQAYQEAGWRDFGGHVIDEEGRHHLRVDQMVPPLYVAVADLMKRVQQLETANV
jgi:hypothetical protein